MKREIKFRGRSKEDTRWRYGFLVHNGKFWYIQEGIVSQGVDEESIGQYTGLKDREGVEIYEGDIVTYMRYSFSRLVQWLTVSTKNGWSIGNSPYWEIIGNSYQNPDLLK